MLSKHKRQTDSFFEEKKTKKKCLRKYVWLYIRRATELERHICLKRERNKCVIYIASKNVHPFSDIIPTCCGACSEKLNVGAVFSEKLNPPTFGGSLDSGALRLLFPPPNVNSPGVGVGVDCG